MSEEAKQTITHILCAVDGSAEACNAAKVAGCLARDLGAALTFISVASALKMTPELERELAVEGLEGRDIPVLPKDAEVCLDTAMRIAQACDAPIAKRRVVVGDPMQQILEAISGEKADLLILGHHKRSTIGRVVRRPLSTRIADETSTQIMLVP